MNFLKTFFQNQYVQKILAVVIFLSTIYLLKDFLAIFFLTFIFSYLFIALGDKVHAFLNTNFLNYLKKTEGSFPWINKILKLICSFNFIVILLYSSFIGSFYLLGSYGAPIIVKEVKTFVKSLPTTLDNFNTELNHIEKSTGYELGLSKILNDHLDKGKLQDMIVPMLENIKNFGSFAMTLVLSLIFSLIFILDRFKLRTYLEKVNDSAFKFLYKEYTYIFGLINNAFGMIFKAQALIALVNSLLTATGLFILSLIFGKIFPFIIILTLVVFLFGFIPVFGTFLSSVPILMVGYSYGHFDAVYLIMGLIFFIHMVEAYYLNPKIVSRYIETPMFLTLIILLVGEHIFGIVGFLVSVPIYYIILEFIKDFTKERV